MKVIVSAATSIANCLFGKAGVYYRVVVTIAILLWLYWPVCSQPQAEKRIYTEMSALAAYSNGFVHDVMIGQAHNGIQLNNQVLFENDGPGAGVSEKGNYLEMIYSGKLARKHFYLDNPSANHAYIVFLMLQSNNAKEPPPYYIIVNGMRIPGTVPSSREDLWRIVEFPTSLLRSGTNEVIIGADAPREKAYKLMFAREDEYMAGGGKYTYYGNTAMISADQIRPIDSLTIDGLKAFKVGATSSKSLDNGKSWIQGKLGPQSNIAGEYTIRLSLERFKSTGTLDSGPIDLWNDDAQDAHIVPGNCKINDLELSVMAWVPLGAQVEWQVRMANTNDMVSNAWGKWQTLGSGAREIFKLGHTDFRYLQWRAILKTDNPLCSPVVKSVNMSRKVSYDSIPPDTYYVREAFNPKHLYSSFRITYADPNHPAMKLLRERLHLDSLLRDTHGDFEKINRMRHLVSTLWYHSAPLPEYPEWNAHAILDRKERRGAGGMCIQFSIVFMQALQSMGYIARHINVMTHETVEAYVNELSSWVHVDPESVFDSYEFNNKTGIPLNALDQHKMFLDEWGFSPINPIRWTSPRPWMGKGNDIEFSPQPVNFSTFTGNVNNPNNPPPQHELTAFIRFVPRTDFFSRPYPRPLTQGAVEWPWNGYINWYDSSTPRKLQYELHTDREADFYPTLNQVGYTATYSKSEGRINIDMITVTPNFDGFEINVDGTGWRSSPKNFVWQLRPAALNKLEMRTRNSMGKTGASSRLVLFWHYRAPYKPDAK